MAKQSKKPWAQMVGRRIREARIRRSWTQADLAEATGLSWNHICNVERAERTCSVDAIWRISQALEVPLSKFFEAETGRLAVTESVAKLEKPSRDGLDRLVRKIKSGRRRRLAARVLRAVLNELP